MSLIEFVCHNSLIAAKMVRISAWLYVSDISNLNLNAKHWII